MPPPAMAATALRGYDPDAMAWTETTASNTTENTCMPENSSVPASLDISDGGLFTVVALRKKRGGQHSQDTGSDAAAATATTVKSPATEKKRKLPAWKPPVTPCMNPEDFSLVLKQRVTAILKDHFKPGELGVALASHVSAPKGDILSVWPIWEQNIVIVTT